jgi:glycerol-3-phosphate dehydrogenase
MTFNFFKHFVKSPVGLAFTIVGGSCSYVGSSYYLSSRRAADDHDDNDEWKQRRSNLLFQDDDDDDYQPPSRPVLSWTMQPVMYSESPVSVSAGDDNNNNNITLWKPPSRQDLLNRLKGFGSDGKTPLPEKDAEYDVLIIGGGATGAGCAVDAASRGLRTACVERDDFASGTSSKSTKLVHGGVRYLEKAFWNLDIEQYKLVAEALSERTTLLKIAPYLAYPLPIMLPIYKWYMVPYYWCGAKAYDLIAGSKNLATSYFLDATKALEAFPMIKQEDLVGAVVYYDGAQNDARMNVALALTAIQQGATVVNHTEVVSLLKEEVAGKEKPQLCGAILRDRLTGETWSVRAKCK